MSVKIISGGTISFDWATVRGIVQNYTPDMVIKVRLAPSGTNPTVWVVESEAEIAPFNPSVLVDYKVWFSFTNLIPNTDYIYEIYVEGMNNLKAQGTFKTLAKPAFAAPYTDLDVSLLNGLYVTDANNPTTNYLILNEIFLHEVSAALADKLMIKTQTYASGQAQTIPVQPILLDHKIFSRLQIAPKPLDPNLDHIKNLSISDYEDNLFFEFNIDTIGQYPGLYFRELQWIEVYPLGSGYATCSLNLSNPDIPDIAPLELEDIDEGVIVLNYEV